MHPEELIIITFIDRMHRHPVPYVCALVTVFRAVHERGPSSREHQKQQQQQQQQQAAAAAAAAQLPSYGTTTTTTTTARTCDTIVPSSHPSPAESDVTIMAMHDANSPPSSTTTNQQQQHRCWLCLYRRNRMIYCRSKHNTVTGGGAGAGAADAADAALLLLLLL